MSTPSASKTKQLTAAARRSPLMAAGTPLRRVTPVTLLQRPLSRNGESAIGATCALPTLITRASACTRAAQSRVDAAQSRLVTLTCDAIDRAFEPTRYRDRR